MKVKNEQALRSGREFEELVFGHVAKQDQISISELGAPTYLHFKNSLQQQIYHNWSIAEAAVEQGRSDYYNPSNPRTGQSHKVWESVKNFLPTEESGKKEPLHFYMSIGRNSLDYWHGVDAFFVWRGTFVTIDLSLGRKKYPSADFILTPADMNDHKRLLVFGRKAADLLIKRHENNETL